MAEESQPPLLDPTLMAARTGDAQAFGRLTEPHRRELQVHCYRLLGSLEEAEDLVQETMLRAWRRLDTYQGRASFRAWLYKIATNACLDELASRKRPRRVLPPDRHPAADPQAPPAPPIFEPIWLEPLPDDLLAGADESPEARYTQRESIALAFLIALQTLPARQRAVVILCDVLDWRASETAAGLGLTVAAVNSALHRARVTLAKHSLQPEALAASHDARTRDLAERYMRAWEAADVGALVDLLKDEAVFTMPPTPNWYQGREAIRLSLSALAFAGPANNAQDGVRERWRLRLTGANASPALAVYRRADDGVYHAFGLQVLRVTDEAIAGVTFFLEPAVLARFSLPSEWPSR
jgi:RNA polymerase sigma-70 factor (ECF subfamily)